MTVHWRAKTEMSRKQQVKNWTSRTTERRSVTRRSTIIYDCVGSNVGHISTVTVSTYTCHGSYLASSSSVKWPRCHLQQQPDFYPAIISYRFGSYGVLKNSCAKLGYIFGFIGCQGAQVQYMYVSKMYVHSVFYRPWSVVSLKPYLSALPNIAVTAEMVKHNTNMSTLCKNIKQCLPSLSHKFSHIFHT